MWSDNEGDNDDAEEKSRRKNRRGRRRRSRRKSDKGARRWRTRAEVGDSDRCPGWPVIPHLGEEVGGLSDVAGVAVGKGEWREARQ